LISWLISMSTFTGGCFGSLGGLVGHGVTKNVVVNNGVVVVVVVVVVVDVVVVMTRGISVVGNRRSHGNVVDTRGVVLASDPLLGHGSRGDSSASASAASSLAFSWACILATRACDL